MTDPWYLRLIDKVLELVFGDGTPESEYRHMLFIHDGLIAWNVIMIGSILHTLSEAV